MPELKVAIIGSGFISGKKHVPAFLRLGKKVHLAALCDLNETLARESAARLGISAVYSDAGEMLAREKPDLVDICTPPASHAKLAINAMKEGAHVLVEKPMALDTSACDDMIQVARQERRKLCVAHSDLFYPPFLRARELIARGAIGNFTGMRIFLSTPTDYMTSQKHHWAHKLPGGVIGETGTHVVYMTLAFINPIQQVKASALKCLPYPWSAFEDYRLDLIGEKAISTATSIYTTEQWAAQVDLWGTEGLLKLDLQLASLVRYRRSALTRWGTAVSGLAESSQLLKDTVWNGTQVLMGCYRNTHDILIASFVDSILHDTPPPVTAEEGREAVRVMNLIVEQLDGTKHPLSEKKPCTFLA